MIKNLLSNKKLRIIILSLIAVIIAVSAFLLVSVLNKQEEVKQFYLNLYGKQYGVSTQEIQSVFKTINDWNKTGQVLAQRKYTFSDDRKKELYQLGYSSFDVAKAQMYAQRSNASAEELLKQRGIPGKNQLSWDNIVNKYKISAKSDMEKLGLSTTQLEKLSALNLTQTELIKAAVIVQQKYKTFDDLLNILKQGQTIEQVFDDMNK